MSESESNEIFFWSGSKESDIVPWVTIKESTSIFIDRSHIIISSIEDEPDNHLKYDSPDQAKSNLLRLMQESIKFHRIENDKIQRIQEDIKAIQEELKETQKMLDIVWLTPGMPGYHKGRLSFLSHSKKRKMSC